MAKFKTKGKNFETITVSCFKDIAQKLNTVYKTYDVESNCYICASEDSFSDFRCDLYRNNIYAITVVFDGERILVGYTNELITK